MNSKIIRILKRKIIWIPLSIAIVITLALVFTDVDSDDDDFEIKTKFPLEDYLFINAKDTNNSHKNQDKNLDPYDSIDEQLKNSKNFHMDENGNIIDENGNIVQPKEKLIVIPNNNDNKKGSASKNSTSNSNTKDAQNTQDTVNHKNSNNNHNNHNNPSKNAQFDYTTASPTQKARLAQLAKRFESRDVNPTDINTTINRDIEYGIDSFSNFDKKDIATNENKLLRTITADRMIPAILITPISSQIGGNKVVAQVESDVYASMGRAVLIPKGSRVIGFYNNNNKIGEYRLEVAWNRILTPQGINIILTNAKGADVKGYAGLVGNLHNKYWERYGLPLSLSTLSNGLLLAISSGLNSKLNSKAGSSGVYQSYQTAQLMGQMKDDVSNIIQQILREQVRIKPIITIKEGSRIFISPNTDIFFPEPKDGEVLAEFFKEYKPIPKEDDLSDDVNEY